MAATRRFVSQVALLAALACALLAVSLPAAAAGGDPPGQPASAPSSRSDAVTIQGHPNPEPRVRTDPGPANTPEAPVAILLPLAGVLGVGAVLYVRNKRQRPATAVE